MLNIRIIFRSISQVCLIETFMLIIAIGAGLFYRETSLMHLIIPAIVAFTLGCLLMYASRGERGKLTRRDGYFTVAVTWVIVSIIGALPFIPFSHGRLGIAFFEAFSGFTTTGCTAIAFPELLPHSLLFWRSFMHWLGGLGIVFFTIALLPSIKGGAVKLFAAEASGLNSGKLHPRISTTARWIWSIYISQTILCTTALFLAGMGGFDAVNHAMSTVASGGFSTYSDSIGHFNSAAIEWVEIFFMFLSGINFTLLYYVFIKRHFRELPKNGELRAYTSCVIGVFLFVCACLLVNVGLYGFNFRQILFQVVSMFSTTGFVTTEYTAWPFVALIVFFVFALIGPMAGSTGGGIKMLRVVTAWKLMVNEFRHILHPRAILPVRMGEHTVSENLIRTIFAFFTLYLLSILLAMIVFLLMGLPMLDAFGVSASMLSNIGPAIGHSFNSLTSFDILPDAGLWFSCILMLAGRLELFVVILPFIPSFWRED